MPGIALSRLTFMSFGRPEHRDEKPSVPVRRGVIKVPPGRSVAAAANYSALSHQTPSRLRRGTTGRNRGWRATKARGFARRFLRQDEHVT